MPGIELGDRRDLVGRQQTRALFADTQLAPTAAAVPALSPVSMTVWRPSSCTSASTRAASGSRPIGQADPAQRARSRSQGDRRPDRVFSLTKLDVKIRPAQTGFVDVTMAAQVIFNGIDSPESAPSPGTAVY